MVGINTMAKAFLFGSYINPPWHRTQPKPLVQMTPKATHLYNPCASPLTLPYIPNFPSSTYTHKKHYVSSGDLCCNLCWASELDCALADFNEFENTCLLTINNATVSEWATETCPLGVLEGDAHRVDANHYAYETSVDGRPGKKIVLTAGANWFGVSPGPCFRLTHREF